MMIPSSVPEHIKAMAPYQPGKPIEELARDYGLDPAQIIKLASNENPLGCSVRVREALASAAAAMQGRYPDPNGYDLKAAVAALHDVPAGWVSLGNGSNDLLEMASLALLDQHTSAVYSRHAFMVYRLSTQARGARHIMVAAQNYGHDLDAMLEAIADDTRLVFIANPNNPTGTHVAPEQIAGFLAEVYRRHGDRVTILLDEAYDEYLLPAQRSGSARWVHEYPNLIVTRTFSKAYGLAGLRVGYALAQAPLTDLLNRVRQPFNVGVLAQLAARVALADTGFLEETYSLNTRGRDYLQNAFLELGLGFVPSHANFVLVLVGDAPRVHDALLRRGIIVRPVAGDDLPQHLRVSVGLPDENERFIEALRDILGS